MNEFELKREAKKIEVLLSGDLTASVASELAPGLRKIIDKGASEVRFHLGNTTIIDSTGIGLLIATYNTMKKHDGAVHLDEASEDILRLLQSMRLEKRLCITAR
jgi:anti-anti-sigma factor